MVTQTNIYAFIILIFCGQSLLGGEPALLPQEFHDLILEKYRHGENTLYQIEVVNQFKEPSELGSSKSSCLYHVLRNGQLFTQGYLFPEDAELCRDRLTAIWHMAHKLSPPLTEVMYDHQSSGDYSCSSDEDTSPSSSSEDIASLVQNDFSWRGFIAEKKAEAQERHENLFRMPNSWLSDPSKTDSPDTELAEMLFDEVEAQQQLDKRKIDTIPVYYTYFENEYGHDLSGELFEAQCITHKARTIKERLQHNQDVVGIIAIHSHSMNISPRVRRRQQGPDLYQGSLENNGHYILFIIASIDGKREYLIADSASRRDHITKNYVVQDLYRYFESPDLSQPICLDNFERQQYLGNDSHIYNGFISSLLGSPRKDRRGSFDLLPKESNTLYYGAIAALITAGYFWYGDTDQPLATSTVVS